MRLKFKISVKARRFHQVMMCVWVALLIPTIVVWSESILWLAFMSLYANFVGHWSAYQGARAEASSSESDNSKNSD